MIPHRNSVRYWLIRALQTRQPSNFRPFNSKWKFNRERDGARLLDYVRTLREIADGLEARVGAK